MLTEKLILISLRNEITLWISAVEHDMLQITIFTKYLHILISYTKTNEHILDLYLFGIFHEEKVQCNSRTIIMYSTY